MDNVDNGEFKSPHRITIFYPCYFLFLTQPLSFDNGWTDRNAHCCVYIVDEKVTMATDLI